MAEQSVPIIGLAGGIGAGKSSVAAMLAEAGCAISDSDVDAREVLQDPEVIALLREALGGEIVDAEGSIDRRRLAAEIFRNPDQRTLVESIMHPRIELRRRDRFERALTAADGPPVALVIDAPLLFEAGLNELCDAVLFVDAPRATRLERLRTNRGWSEEELNRRESAQWPVERKRAAASHVLPNDGDGELLRRRTLSALQEILATFSGSA